MFSAPPVFTPKIAINADGAYVRALKTLLGFRSDVFKSLVAFSDHAVFKTVPPEFVVIGGPQYIRSIKKHQTILLSDEQVLAAIEKIRSHRLTNQEHQASMRENRQKYEHIDESKAPQCPRCLNAMVLRHPKSTNKHNPFWGCSTYPHCKAIVHIKNNKTNEMEPIKNLITALISGKFGRP